MTDSNSNSFIASTREELASLDVRRKALEHEAEAITSELTSPTGDDGTGLPMGVDTPLVDRDGYPRSDIDIYRARSLRGRLAEIRTDHKHIMKQIESLLLQLSTLVDSNKQKEIAQEQQARLAKKPKPKFDPVSGKWVVSSWDGNIVGAGSSSETRSFDTIDATTPPLSQLSQVAIQSAAATQGGTRGDVIDDVPQSPPPTTPFAKVDGVAPRSPAAEAGIQEGDFVLKFGDITFQTIDPFREIALLVPEAAGQHHSIVILVQRASAVESERIITHTLRLTPRPWEGRGLLGCHIIPAV